MSEDRPITGPFDIVLCLDVLHHLRDPIGTLRYLALDTRGHLVIEAASPGKHATKKHAPRLPVAALALKVLNRYPVAYVGPYTPSQLSQSYFFTASALRRILDSHMRLFQRIEGIPLQLKGRYLLRCTRLQIDRMVVVSGACSSGKSTLCNKIARNEFREELGIDDMSTAPRISPTKLWEGATELKFPKAHNPFALYHYDISLIDQFNLPHFARDPAADLLRCADEVDFVIPAPTVETLTRQLMNQNSMANQSKSTIAVI